MTGFAAVHESVHGTTRTFRNVCCSVAIGVKADIERVSFSKSDLSVHALRRKRRLQAQIARSAGYPIGATGGCLWAKAGSSPCNLP